MAGPFPRYLWKVMGHPDIKNPGVCFDFPAIRQRNVLTFLMNPVIDGTKPQASFCFQECDEIGDEGCRAKSFAKPSVEFCGGKANRNFEGKSWMARLTSSE